MCMPSTRSLVVLAWEQQIFDYQVHPARHSSGPIIANGKVISGRSCRPKAGPVSCVILAHDAMTGEELWRAALVPAPGEPGDETWGGVPYEERMHVGSWMVPSYDPELNLVYVGTSVTSPAPKFMLGGVDNAHLYHNSTLALDGDTGEIRWYYQHLNDHWDLDHPYERLLVDTAVAPNPSEVSWINPRVQPGEMRKVVTGIPGKTGVVYTLDREDRRVLVGDADHRAERHQPHRWRHWRCHGELRGRLYRIGSRSAFVSLVGRWKELAGRGLQPVDQYDVFPAQEHLCACALNYDRGVSPSIGSRPDSS